MNDLNERDSERPVIDVHCAHGIDVLNKCAVCDRLLIAAATAALERGRAVLRSTEIPLRQMMVCVCPTPSGATYGQCFHCGGRVE